MRLAPQSGDVDALLKISASPRQVEIFIPGELQDTTLRLSIDGINVLIEKLERARDAAVLMAEGKEAKP